MLNDFDTCYNFNILNYWTFFPIIFVIAQSRANSENKTKPCNLFLRLEKYARKYFYSVKVFLLLTNFELDFFGICICVKVPGVYTFGKRTPQHVI